jgi:Cu/Ag efflux pump CusA
LLDRNKQIPVMTRLPSDERSRLEDVGNLYVYGSQGAQKLPLKEISHIRYVSHDEVVGGATSFAASWFPLYRSAVCWLRRL